MIENILGKVVYSKSGRDQGRMFIIVSVVNETKVAVADGDLRKIEKPKVKNIKHLQLTGKMSEEIAAILRRGELPGNHVLRKYIRSLQGADESFGKEA